MINAMANKYLVVSPNGFGNIGDDICAYSGKYAIEQVDPGAEVKITQPPMKANLIEWADYVILSGGGILYDRAPKNLENYMSYIDTAVAAGKKAAVLGVGVQGIVTDEGKKSYVESLSKCEFVSVRTEVDRQMLEDIGFKGAMATFDIAFLTTEMVKGFEPQLSWWRKRRTKSITQMICVIEKPKIGICMINLKMLKRDKYEGVFSKFDEVIEQFIAEAKDKFDIYLIQHAKEDGDLMRDIAKRTGANFIPYQDINDLPLISQLYSKLDLMIGVRLHSVALGVMNEVPTFAIGSATAKQKRLVDYALPSMKHQFFDFNDVDRLEKALTKAAASGKIEAKPISKTDRQKIDQLNAKNVDLIRKMLKS